MTVSEKRISSPIGFWSKLLSIRRHVCVQLRVATVIGKVSKHHVFQPLSSGKTFLNWALPDHENDQKYTKTSLVLVSENIPIFGTIPWWKKVQQIWASPIKKIILGAFAKSKLDLISTLCFVDKGSVRELEVWKLLKLGQRQGVLRESEGLLRSILGCHELPRYENWNVSIQCGWVESWAAKISFCSVSFMHFKWTMYHRLPAVWITLPFCSI